MADRFPPPFARSVPPSYAEVDSHTAACRMEPGRRLQGIGSARPATLPRLPIAKKMDFRRSGQLDERRRRVLRDELAQPAQTETADATPTGGGSAKGPVRAYATEVLSERQLRVIDLLPVRPLWVAVSILLAVTAVAAILCVHIHARTIDLGRNATEGVPYSAFLAALDASQRGSLAAWLASVVLAGGAAASLVTFGIRLHRVDDYRGRYRVWLWTAAALVFASLDAATHSHGKFQ